MGREAEARRNDLRVLDAAREVFATQGFDAPVAAVAQRAGVGMGSLYRRYGTKADLLRHLCVLAMEQAVEAGEAGLADEDPWRGLAGYVRTCVGFGSGALAPLAGTIETTPDMWRLSRRSRRLLAALVARARRAGVVRADLTALDVAWLFEQVSHRPAHALTAEDDHVRERLLTLALDGLRAGHSGRLPGRPPSRTHYERRWA
jgi:AcrR family transcriptional regulator